MNFKYLAIVICLLFVLSARGQVKETRALLIIDIQEFYFPGGFSELHNPEQAAKNAAVVLEAFRQDSGLVIHVQHKTESQMAISKIVEPKGNEKVFVKSEVNCFNGTGLQAYLQANEITELVIVGMQTHMCVEAATRAGYDLGYKISLIEDACTTKDLKWGDNLVLWHDVHYSTLATLKNYATIFTLNDWLKANE